jgi:hypothetical protein
VENWDPDNDKGVPMAVKVTVAEGAETTPLVVIAPIYQEMEKT